MSEGEFLLNATHTSTSLLRFCLQKRLVFPQHWSLEGLGWKRVFPEQLVSQSSTSAGITVSGHINRVINMSSRSLKFRIDEYDWQTAQINMLIIEAVRRTKRHAESSHTSFSPSFPNLICFYFVPHEKWMGSYLLFLMSFSLSILPPSSFRCE